MRGKEIPNKYKDHSLRGNWKKCKDVLFVDASHEMVSGKNQNSLSPEHLQRIVDTVGDLNCMVAVGDLDSRDVVDDLDGMEGRSDG